MKHWHDISLLKSLGAGLARPGARPSHTPDIIEDDPDLMLEDIVLEDDPDVADSDLLAAVMEQTGGIAARSAVEPAGQREVAWSLPGFEGKCRVATNFGDLPIEALRRRDKVKTLSGAYREVQWIDQIRLDADFISRHPEALPVMIRAKALGGVNPVQNMLVSPGQQVWVPKVSDGCTAETAAALQDKPGILRARRNDITYYRFHCGEPEKICIEGAYFCIAPET